MNQKNNPVKVPLVKSAGLTTVPIGPFHPALIEPTFLTLKCDGELVKAATMKTGFAHRSIQFLMEKRTYHRNVYLSERVCGICSNNHAMTYSMCIESMLGITNEIPERAQIIRTIMNELERIHSHLLWVGVAGDLIGFETLFMHAWRDREIVMDMLEYISGNRVNYGMQDLGGVRRDIPNSTIPKIRNLLGELKKVVDNLAIQINSDRIVELRLKDVGTMSAVKARKLGVVGPTARGSGLKIDCRRDNPILIYDELDWNVITESKGDSLARALVRVRELYESVTIIDQCLDRLEKCSSSELKLHTLPNVEAGKEAISSNEAARGELLYHVISNNTATPERVKIRTPSIVNNAALPHMLVENTIADAPLIVGSIDPCYSCTDRITKIKDVNSGRSYNTTLGKIIREKLRNKEEKYL